LLVGISSLVIYSKVYKRGNFYMAAPVAPEAKGKGFIARELNGASFLTLEHIGHMALVVIVSGLIVSGIGAAFSMWFGTAGVSHAFLGDAASLLGGMGTKTLEATMALGIVAALIVLVPALVILDRRTRAEWHKRPGYAGRLAYKVPVYTALAALAAVLVTLKIQMLYVVISSLAFIGVQGAEIGDMYMQSFIPALIAYAVFGVAAWYVFNLAKGRDNGRLFSLAKAVGGGILAVALFITSLVILHDTKTDTTVPSVREEGSRSTQPTEPTYDEDYYRELLDKYYQ
jgi:hypothetical protein